MTTILISIIYILMAGIIYFKQVKVFEHENYVSPEGASIFCAIFWPITVIVYIIKTVFINDWK